MKILFGIDSGRNYGSALNLASRLKFRGSEWLLAHSVDLTCTVTGYGVGELGYGTEWGDALTEAGERSLEEAAESACAHGYATKPLLLSGSAGEALLVAAEDVEADLIVVHSTDKGRIGSLFLNSVSRALSIAAGQSVLISKGKISPKGPIKAVFATDHSEYATKALDRFIAMGCEGISSIKVITALHVGEINTPQTNHLFSEATRQTKEAVAKLQAAGFTCSGEVIDAPVYEAIDRTMALTKADLLILGAQGHGFMRRLIVGSTALHEVVAEPHPVLIVRP
jgi:nucleotide-binding universal stress UspA family protein